jgi:hypothetical protein
MRHSLPGSTASSAANGLLPAQAESLGPRPTCQMSPRACQQIVAKASQRGGGCTLLPGRHLEVHQFGTYSMPTRRVSDFRTLKVANHDMRAISYPLRQCCWHHLRQRASSGPVATHQLGGSRSAHRYTLSNACLPRKTLSVKMVQLHLWAKQLMRSTVDFTEL